jgi:hypothetical protein
MVDNIFAWAILEIELSKPLQAVFPTVNTGWKQKIFMS